MSDLIINTHWGCVMEPISEQLNSMGIPMAAKKYDRLKESINYLELSGIFTDSQISTLYKRVQKSLTQDLKECFESLSDDDYLLMVRRLEKYNEQFK